jgi:hypothetical protein
VADLLRQRQAFWQLPTVVSVLAGGGGGGRGSICRLCDCWAITTTCRV